MERFLKDSTAYKNCVIRGESFQLARDAGWIPLYKLTRQETRHRWNSTPSRHNRLDQVVDTESDANRFALQVAMRWIDDASELQGKNCAKMMETAKGRRDVGTRLF